MLLFLSCYSLAGEEKKPSGLKVWKNKLGSSSRPKTNLTPQGVSTAMDARLEHGLGLGAELKLKVGKLGNCKIQAD